MQITIWETKGKKYAITRLPSGNLGFFRYIKKAKISMYYGVINYPLPCKRIVAHAQTMIDNKRLQSEELPQEQLRHLHYAVMGEIK